jgi:alpha-beta hydrolase superfamily lysophospholipase
MLKFPRRKRLVIAALVILTCWLGISGAVTWQLTRRRCAPYAEPAPKVAWAAVESHRLQTADGQQIGAWLVRGDRHKGCVLLLHGIGVGRQDMLPVMRFLAQARFTVLAISLRCHGDSTGAVNDVGWSARHDVVAAVDFLRREFPQQPIFVVGRSMGAAAAIYAAADLQDRVAGYFLEEPYKDLQSAVWNRLQNHLVPGLDLAAYYGMRLWGPVFLPVGPDQLSPYDHVSDIPETVPVVFAAGLADRNARPDEIAAMYRRIASHAKLVVFKGARHQGLDGANPQLYRATLLELLSGNRP